MISCRMTLVARERERAGTLIPDLSSEENSRSKRWRTTSLHQLSCVVQIDLGADSKVERELRVEADALELLETPGEDQLLIRHAARGGDFRLGLHARRIVRDPSRDLPS